MKILYIVPLCFILATVVLPAFSQTAQNCFLNDFEPKYANVPPSVDSVKTKQTPTVVVTVNGTDDLGKISKYLFGNAVAVWVNQDVNNPTLLPYLQKLAPTLIRYPGGSWSDGFFWNKDPGDLPATVYDGTTYNSSTGSATKVGLSPHFGPNQKPSLDRYYNLCEQLFAQGLITINYAYARYGLSANPVAQAAHLAADWVRYDNGRTAFWEIGNENAGPWEVGWMIDTTTNKDHQPMIITGQLYGKHFKVFADSMRAAAAEKGATIYIGGQIIHYDGTYSWNIGDRGWNQGFFKEAGDAPDFYVMHNYFGALNNINGTTIKAQVTNSQTEINSNISFIRQDIADKNAPMKPVALTEWNCNGPDTAKISIANGMQAVILFCEMMKNNFGMSCRWLITNWETDGMFYLGNSSTVPQWTPRPDYYYTYFVQKFSGDHALSTSVTGSSDVLAYASKFSSGHTGVVIINKGTVQQTLKLDPKDIGLGNKYYIYSLTGVEKATWPVSVAVNGVGPTVSFPWGPLTNLSSIKAWSYPVGDTIRFISPAYSVQFVLLDTGNRYLLTGINENTNQNVEQFTLEQNYPNPFNPSTVIRYQLPDVGTMFQVSMKVYDILGKQVALLVDGLESAGYHSATFDGTHLASGMYFYVLESSGIGISKKMLLLK